MKKPTLWIVAVAATKPNPDGSLHLSYTLAWFWNETKSSAIKAARAASCEKNPCHKIQSVLPFGIPSERLAALQPSPFNLKPSI